MNGNFIAATVDTRDEAISRFHESPSVYFEYVKDSGGNVPQVTEFDLRELISTQVSRPGITDNSFRPHGH